MGFRGASSRKFLWIPGTFWRRPAQRKLTEAGLEGHFTNARAIWTA